MTKKILYIIGTVTVHTPLCVCFFFILYILANTLIFCVSQAIMSFMEKLVYNYTYTAYLKETYLVSAFPSILLLANKLHRVSQTPHLCHQIAFNFQAHEEDLTMTSSTGNYFKFVDCFCLFMLYCL